MFRNAPSVQAGLYKIKSVIQTQRNYRTQLSIPPQSNKTITDWERMFLETVRAYDHPRSGRPSVNDDVVEQLKDSFTRSPKKSLRRISGVLGVSRPTIHKVLHKVLRLCAYKFQLVQRLNLVIV